MFTELTICTFPFAIYMFMGLNVYKSLFSTITYSIMLNTVLVIFHYNWVAAQCGWGLWILVWLQSSQVGTGGKEGMCTFQNSYRNVLTSVVFSGATMQMYHMSTMHYRATM